MKEAVHCDGLKLKSVLDYTLASRKDTFHFFLLVFRDSMSRAMYETFLYPLYF